MKRFLKIAVLLLILSCSTNEDSDVVGSEPESNDLEIPNSPIDYDTMVNWYFHPDQNFNFLETYNLDIALIDEDLQIDSVVPIQNNATTNTGIDIFWVHPTHLDNPPTSPTTIPLTNQDTNYIGLTILAQGALLAKYGRFFAPKYRQASPASFLSTTHSEEERAMGLLGAYSDIKAAFENYLEHHNNGNKIILAGHSQGSFLLGMLVRDLFDTNPALREKLVTAALGGMGYVYGSNTSSIGGWWENIGLCTTTNECNCVHYWRSYEENEPLPEPKVTFPSYSPLLVDAGLVFRTTNSENDTFYQDDLVYDETSKPLRYITPGAPYQFSQGANFIAFDGMYNAYFKRESKQKVGLAVSYTASPSDQRPNELNNLDNPVIFTQGDYHIRDYHIYLWALMEQIDAKVLNCL